MIRVKVEREDDEEEQTFLYFKLKSTSENSEKSTRDGNRLMSDYLSVTAKHHQVTLDLKKANDMSNALEREKQIILDQAKADKTEIASLKQENMSLKRQVAGKDEITPITLISSLKESLNVALEEIIVLQSRPAKQFNSHQLKEDFPEDSDTKSDIVASLKKKNDELNIELRSYIDLATLSTSLRNRLELAQDENKEIKHQIKSFEEENSSLKSKVGLSQTELSEIDRKMDIQTKALQLKKDQHDALQKQHEAVTSKNQNIEAELALLKNNHDSSKAENVSLQKDLVTVKINLESKTELTKKQDEIIINSKKEIDDLKIKLKDHSDLVSLANSLQNSLQTVEAENKQLLNQIKTFEEEILTLEGKVNSSQTELSEVEKGMDIQTKALKLKENDHSELQVKHREAISKIQHLESELALHKQKLDSSNKEITSLQENILMSKTAQKSGEDNIRSLQKDKLNLQARLNQIRSSSYNTPAVKRSNPESSIDHSSTSSSSKTKRKKDDCIFEVEELMAHKIENGTFFYKVRWMTYGPEDDTWECESNLSCPNILLDYKKKHNFK